MKRNNLTGSYRNWIDYNYWNNMSINNLKNQNLSPISTLLSIWNVIWRTMLIFMIFLSISEISARIWLAEHPESRRSLGMRNALFEMKWFQIQEYVENNGGLDMIILGSSLAHSGVDPDAMEKIIYERTGINLRIYNFGLDGVTLPTIMNIGRLLVAQYQPEILLIINEPRDFDIENGILEQILFQSSPWITYQNDQFSPIGWLINSSVALQLYLPIRNWMAESFNTQMEEHEFRFNSLWDTGYEANNGINLISERSINPFRPGEKYLMVMFDRYEIDQGRLQSLNAFLAEMESENVQVIIAEWPFPSSIFNQQGSHDTFQLFTGTISEIGDSLNIDVINPLPENAIQIGSRSDRYHFNRSGAYIYSQYLASQISELSWFRSESVSE